DQIKLNNNFVITTHANPDGDAIGSELALARYLSSIKKNVKILNCSPTPEYLKFMLNSEDEVFEFDPKLQADLIKKADVIFVLDLNHLNRTKSLENFIRESASVKICIDHHEYPEDFGKLGWIDTSSSSTGELIYKLIKTTNTKINYEFAVPIYVAIMTDTGSFKYERTTSELHRITAELLDAGVVPKIIHQEIYEQGSANRIQLLGRAFNSLVIDGDGKIAYMKITSQDLTETNTTEEDVEGFVNYTLSIKGVEVGIFFFELESGFKMSFRSATKVPVNKLAAEFNGGGHFFAAGARLETENMESTIPKIIETANEYLQQYLK
ncbi:MAG: bifunctional oligoribonuclease/PAP phosphatase NrnA, partial [Bacteroidetes bacterium]|nr:bifunctional oligoribonuclease/PAP phosphatase NrnA [Bacteroidota bacterium]MBU1800102.1 bifunctional oligoribonuclease/PAP phosphatase NrnA [Bacteroidota bacterium]